MTATSTARVVADTAKVVVFKQITTAPRYKDIPTVVADTAKVVVFKQITTIWVL